MEKMSLTEAAAAMGAQLHIAGEEAVISGVAFDSRKVKPGDLFFALHGVRDGHDFVEDAFQHGAVAAVVSNCEKLPESVRMQKLLIVDQPLAALQRLAVSRRKKFHGHVIAVTGSTGKTSTKDVIASVLERKFTTVRTAGNYNNEIGLPLTLLELTPRHGALVVEMGMRGTGEIAFLSQLAKPQVGVITNIGYSHIELLGSQEAIARAKWELIESLPSDGFALLNGDDPWCRRLAKDFQGKFYFYGIDQEADIKGENIRVLGEQGSFFTLAAFGSRTEVYLPVPGRHNIMNSLAALGTGILLGIEPEEAAQGLRELRLSQMRQEIHQGVHDSRIINDAYNANPTSMAAALQTLKEIAAGRRIAVLGDMLELGNYAATAHHEIGRLAADLKLDLLLTYGELALEIAQGAKDAGMRPERIMSFQDKKQLGETLLQLLQPGDTVLVKGSRGMRLEEVTAQLIVDCSGR